MDAHTIYCTEDNPADRYFMKILLDKFNAARIDSYVHILFFNDNSELFDHIQEIEHGGDERIPDMFLLN